MKSGADEGCSRMHPHGNRGLQFQWQRRWWLQVATKPRDEYQARGSNWMIWTVCNGSTCTSFFPSYLSFIFFPPRRKSIEKWGGIRSLCKILSLCFVRDIKTQKGSTQIPFQNAYQSFRVILRKGKAFVKHLLDFSSS